MEKHVTAVAILHIGLGILGLLITAVLLLALIAPGFFVLAEEGTAQPLGILSVVACGVGGFISILSLPGIIGGLGLLRFRPWARYLVMILGVLQLFNVPIGTAVGAYTLWVLVQDETEELFAPIPG